jgi:hypothetical protein
VVPASSTSFCCVGVSRGALVWLDRNGPGALDRAADIDLDRLAALRRGDWRSTLRWRLGDYARDPGEPGVDGDIAAAGMGGRLMRLTGLMACAKHGLHDLSPGWGLADRALYSLDPVICDGGEADPDN